MSLTKWRSGLPFTTITGFGDGKTDYPNHRVDLGMRPIWDEELNPHQLLWRYFNASRFLSFLKTGALYFAPVSNFNDRFEGAVAIIPPQLVDPRYEELDFADNAFCSTKDDTNVNCWHQAEHENDAMWKLYAEESKGVAISSTVSRMRMALKPFFLHHRLQNRKNSGSVQFAMLTLREFDSRTLALKDTFIST